MKLSKKVGSLVSVSAFLFSDVSWAVLSDVKLTKPPAPPEMTHEIALDLPVPSDDTGDAPSIPRRALPKYSSVNHGNQHPLSNKDYRPRQKSDGVDQLPFPPPSMFYSEVVGEPGPEDDPVAWLGCNAVVISGLSPADMVTWVQTHDQSCMNSFLYRFTNETPAIFSEANMTAVIKEIDRVASRNSNVNNAYLDNLLHYIAVGYYHQYYHPGYSFDATQMAATLTRSLQDVINNPVVLSGTSNFQGQVLANWLDAVDNSNLGHHFYDQIKSVLRNMQTDTSRFNSWWQLTAYYNACYLITRANRSLPDFRLLVDADLVTILDWFAVNSNLTSPYLWLQRCAIWVLGSIYNDVPTMSSTALIALTDVINTQPYLNIPYITAVKYLTAYSPCVTLSNQVILCKQTVVNDLISQLFPSQYAFDDGSLIVNTPLGLSVIQPLYYASKQVEAQFGRLSGAIVPLPNDLNPTLKMYIYGTRSDYEDYQDFLFGLGTNNGGIYIEGTGTFFTYQRTTYESYLTLEDLFRHEYTHYLVNRFIIPGFWGVSPIYDDNRLTWFNEGVAEFFAGSSAGQGVLPRRVIFDFLASHGRNPSNRMHVPDIVHAAYGDFVFYRYSAALIYYLYLNRKTTLRDLFVAATAYDGVAFDAVVNQMVTDATVDAGYQAYLDTALLNYNQLTDPMTVAPTSLSTGDLNLIQSTFRTARGGAFGSCSIAATQLNGRFSCRGELVGTTGVSQDWEAAWTGFNSNLDSIISTLSSSTVVSNFSHLVCKMGKVTFSPSGSSFYPLASYVCEGPLPSQSLPPLQFGIQDQLDFRSTRLGAFTNCNSGSSSGAVTTTCTTGLTTVAVDTPTLASIPAGVVTLTGLLNANFDNLQNQVYSIRPPYYRTLSCTLDPNSISTNSIANGTQHYMTGSSVCVISH